MNDELLKILSAAKSQTFVSYISQTKKVRSFPTPHFFYAYQFIFIQPQY
jgi:exonuclease V gamma subunit